MQLNERFAINSEPQPAAPSAIHGSLSIFVAVATYNELPQLMRRILRSYALGYLKRNGEPTTEAMVLAVLFGDFRAAGGDWQRVLLTYAEAEVLSS